MKLRYTLPALSDLNAVLDSIAAHSPQGARRVHTRIQAIIGLLLLLTDLRVKQSVSRTRERRLDFRLLAQDSAAAQDEM